MSAGKQDDKINDAVKSTTPEDNLRWGTLIDTRGADDKPTGNPTSPSTSEEVMRGGPLIDIRLGPGHGTTPASQERMRDGS